MNQNNFIAELSEIVSRPVPQGFQCPFGELKDGEVVVGVASDRIKAIVAELRNLEEKVADYDACVDPDSVDSPDIRRLAGKRYILVEKGKVLGSILRIMMHEEFPMLIDKYMISIRSGWRIVYKDVPLGPTPNSTGAVEEIVNIVLSRMMVPSVGKN